EADAAADAEDGGHRPDRDADPLAREFVADDREGEREDRPRTALEAAEDDQRPDVPGERGADAAEQEDDEADQQQPLLPVLIAELSEERRPDGCGQEKSG